MIHVPVPTPVTTPVLGLMERIAGHAADHVPPGDAVDIEIVDPTQTEPGPTIGGAADTTVTTTCAAQPPTVYLMVVVPGFEPVTMPVSAPTDAIVTGVLVHRPPEVELDNEIDAPTQTLVGPEIADGNGFTVIILVTKHPPPMLYVTTPVPTDMPVTTPVVDPTLIFPDDVCQVPPATEFESVVLVPTHTVESPVIAPGVGVTVTVFTSIQPNT